MNTPTKEFFKKLSYPKVLWYWLGGMIAVIIAVALYANFSTVQSQMAFEWQEHVTGFPQSAPMPVPGQAQMPIVVQSQAVMPVQVQPVMPAQAQANIPVAFNPGGLEGTYNQIADTMSKISVSIYSDVGPQTEPQLLGSGVVISNQCVLTNLHIVKGKVNLFVTTEKPTTASYPVQLGRADPASDLALLNVGGNAALIAFARISDSDVVKTGDVVFAMGNAYGNGNFFTSGMVQSTGVFYDANQQPRNGQFLTNINIYPGFCGSPLMNMQGEVIGINNSVNCKSSIGMGQATPINRALALLRGDVQNPGMPGMRMATPMPQIQMPSVPGGNPYSLA